MKVPQNNLLSLLTAIVLPVVGGGVVGIVTNRAIPTWYAALKKPAWNPPNWIFGPVWTVLYGLMGLASWLVWKQRSAQPDRTRDALQWYGLQLGLNLWWSVIFFGFRRPDLALLEIITLWSAIMVTLSKFARLDRLAAGLLVPYQLWVTFAATLNAAIWWLNRD